MTNREELLQKLIKLKTLSEKGIGGEREAARRQLDKLMVKYGVQGDELGEIAYHAWTYKKDMNGRLLLQVIYSVMGTTRIYQQAKNKAGCDCTKAEAIEIEAKYGFYKSAMKADLETFYTAFCMKNRIYPPQTKLTPEELAGIESHELTDEDRKAIKLSEAIDANRYHKQIAAH